MSSFLQDLRYALRALAHRPGYAVVSVLTFTIGIGANLAIFSLANALLLRPVPGTTNPAGLVRIMRIDRERPSLSNPMSFPLYEAMRNGMPALAGLACATGASPTLALAASAVPRPVRAQLVTGNYFEVVGVRLAAGRGITPADDSPQGDAVAVVSHQFWQSALGADPGFPGKTLQLNDRTYTIVGIAHPAFRGHGGPATTELWAAISRHRDLSPRMGDNVLQARGTSFLSELVGRLSPAATIARAQAQADAISDQIVSWSPVEAANANRRRLVLSEGIGLTPSTRARVADTLGSLGSAVALLLALACLNVAALWRTRATERQRDLALRRALGASAWDLARQQMLEYALIALVSGAASVGLCWSLAQPLGRIQLLSYLPAPGDVSPDWRVLGAALAASAICGLSAGLLPAIASSRRDPLVDLKAIGPSAHPRAGYLLAGAQLALSLALLVGAELLLGTVRHLMAVDLGYTPRGLVTAMVSPSSRGYSDERRQLFYRALLQRLRQTPGLDAALAMTAPFSGFTSQVRVSKDADARQPGQAVLMNQVSGDYFKAIGLPLVAGRSFTVDEEFSIPGANAGALVVSRRLARQLFGDQRAAVGRTAVIGGTPVIPRPIVGVVADARMATVKGDAELEVYMPLGQSPHRLPSFVTIHVRSAAPVRDVASAIQREVSALDASLPVTQVASGTSAIEDHLSEERVMAWAVGTFAVLALVLAGVGVYGVMAYSVASRVRELGIRTALGATPARVASFVLGRALLVCACGVAAGLVCGAALARALASRLFGVGPFDAPAFVLASALLVMIVLVAATLPARRAMRVDPLTALRSD